MSSENLTPDDCPDCDGFGTKDGRSCSTCNRTGTVITCCNCGARDCDGECDWADVEIEAA